MRLSTYQITALLPDASTYKHKSAKKSHCGARVLETARYGFAWEYSRHASEFSDNDPI